VISIVKSCHLVLKKYMPCLKLGQNPKISHKNMYNAFLAKSQSRKINMLCGDAKGCYYTNHQKVFLYGEEEQHEGGKN